MQNIMFYKVCKPSSDGVERKSNSRRNLLTEEIETVKSRRRSLKKISHRFQSQFTFFYLL